MERSWVDEMMQKTERMDGGVPEMCKDCNERNDDVEPVLFTFSLSVLIFNSASRSREASPWNVSELDHAPHEPRSSVRRCRKRVILDVDDDLSDPSIVKCSRARAEEDNESRMDASSRVPTPSTCFPSGQSMDPIYLNGQILASFKVGVIKTINSGPIVRYGFQTIRCKLGNRGPSPFTFARDSKT